MFAQDMLSANPEIHFCYIIEYNTKDSRVDSWRNRPKQQCQYITDGDQVDMLHTGKYLYTMSA